MRYVADDDLMGYGEEVDLIPDYPAEIELLGAFRDPLVLMGIDQMLDEAISQGIDLDDPELLGGWLKKLIGKIKKRRAARKKSGQPAPIPTVSVDTGQGVAQVGPGGVTWTDPVTQAPVAAPATGGIGDMLKNPWVLGGGAALALLLIMSMRRR